MKVVGFHCRFRLLKDCRKISSRVNHPSALPSQGPSLWLPDNPKVAASQPELHPGSLTLNLQITHLERNMIFQTSMTMLHVNLHGVYI